MWPAYSTTVATCCWIASLNCYSRWKPWTWTHSWLHGVHIARDCAKPDAAYRRLACPVAPLHEQQRFADLEAEFHVQRQRPDVARRLDKADPFEALLACSLEHRLHQLPPDLAFR